MADPANRYWLLAWHYEQGEKFAAMLRPGDTFTGAWGHPMCPHDEHSRFMFTRGFMSGLNTYRAKYGTIATLEHGRLIQLPK
jgi:hypothetical protein